MSPAHSTHMPPEPSSTNFPLLNLCALALTGFLAIVTEVLPAGLLPQISADLQISEAWAGQLITLYALGTVMAAIPLTTLTRSLRRKPVLLVAIICLLLFNTLTTISTHYGLTLVARFCAGMATGLIWGLLAGYARRMAHPSQQGRALAVAMVGTPIALAAGIPIATWLGTLLNWRLIFGLISIATLLLVIWVALKLPDFSGQKNTERQALRQMVSIPGLASVLGVVFLWMLAHNLLYTYIAPFLNGAGLSHRVDLVLLTFGLSSLIGIALTALWVDRNLRRLTLLSLAGFALTALLLGLWGHHPALVYAATALWGLTFGGAATLLQTACAQTSGPAGDVAQSMLVSIWSLAIGAGSLVGGLLLVRIDVALFPWLLLLFILPALILVSQARQHGFKPHAS